MFLLHLNCRPEDWNVCCLSGCSGTALKGCFQRKQPTSWRYGAPDIELWSVMISHLKDNCEKRARALIYCNSQVTIARGRSPVRCVRSLGLLKITAIEMRDLAVQCSGRGQVWGSLEQNLLQRTDFTEGIELVLDLEGEVWGKRSQDIVRRDKIYQ